MLYLAPLTSAFLSGIFLCFMRLDILPVCAGVLILAIIITLKRGNRISAFICILLFILGYMRANAVLGERERIAYEFDSLKLKTEFTVTDFPKDDVFTAKMKLGGKPMTVSVTLEKCSDLLPGDIVEAEILLSAPVFRKNSSFDYGNYLSARNIYLTAKGGKYSVKGRDKSLFYGTVFSVRRYVASVSEKFFTSDTRAMFRAMILGDKSLISDELSKSLRASGLGHIAVVSGMHLSVVMSAVLFIINRLLGKGRKSIIISMLFLIFITFIMGCGASVIRACIMYMIYFLASILYRERDNLSSLCSAILLMLIYNPFTVFNTGFVFSVLSVLGIILFSQRISDALNKYMPENLAAVPAVTLSVQITVMPVSIYLFSEISLYGILSNMLVCLLSSVTIISGILMVVFAKIPLLSVGIAAICKASLRGIISAAYAVERLPFSTISTPHIGLFLLIFCFTVIFIVYFHPEHTLKILLAVFLLFITSCQFIGALKSGEMEITFIPYSKGDCTLITLPKNSLIMIDCQSSYDAENLLNSKNAQYYDCAILCSKNYSNLLKLAQKGMIKTLILPENIRSSKLNDMLDKIKSTDIIFLNENEPVNVSGAKAEYLKYGVLKITYGGGSFLTMQSLSQNEAENIYKSGCIFKADAVKLPILHSDTLKLLKSTYIGETVSANKIILKV